jgi:hypothetical protein
MHAVATSQFDLRNGIKTTEHSTDSGRKERSCLYSFGDWPWGGGRASAEVYQVNSGNTCSAVSFLD